MITVVCGLLADTRAAGSYVVEHLASFDAAVSTPDSSADRSRMAAGQNLMMPDEAMLRLRQLTMRRSIYTTRVTIVITATELMVFDAETNAIMERFPLSLVYRPTAMMSDVVVDVYDNVVVLIVLGDAQQQHTSEVHIFQCLKNRASSSVINTTTAITIADIHICGDTYIFVLCFAVTEQLDMNIKKIKKYLRHIYNNTMQCNNTRPACSIVVI